METVTYGWWLPNISTYGQAIDRLIIVVHWFMAVLFVGWGLFLLYTLIRFRQRPDRPASYESSHSKFPKLLEIGVVLFEAFLLIGLSFPIWSKYRAEFPPESESLVIRVVAQQFVWNVHYPGRDGTFGKTEPKLTSDSNPIGLDLNDPAARDDIVTVNQLHFPVNKPVIAHLMSKDVIHSFSIPVLRVKQDTIPGMSIPVWWQATKTGNFEIACAQLCGVGHTLMRGFVTIDTPESFAAWMAEQEAQLAPPPTTQPAETAPALPPAAL
jgi:cytochrome c oxidase subunit 2